MDRPTPDKDLPLPHGKLLSAETYALVYGTASGFEAVCVEGRQSCNETFLLRERPRKILEVGCGPILLQGRPALNSLEFEKWTIVEPAPSYVRRARAATRSDARFEIHEAYMESAVDMLAGAFGTYDCAVVSGVVPETSDPRRLLASTSMLLKPRGKIIISAPNAQSFHRLLAVTSGMIGNPYDLSDRNRKLGIATVYDLDTLSELATNAGFVDLELGGYLFKPFTNAHMEALSSHIPDEVWSGLIELGRQFPRHSAEIYVIGTKPNISP